MKAEWRRRKGKEVAEPVDGPLCESLRFQSVATADPLISCLLDKST